MPEGGDGYILAGKEAVSLHVSFMQELKQARGLEICYIYRRPGRLDTNPLYYRWDGQNCLLTCVVLVKRLHFWFSYS